MITFHVCLRALWRGDAVADTELERTSYGCCPSSCILAGHLLFIDLLSLELSKLPLPAQYKWVRSGPTWHGDWCGDWHGNWLHRGGVAVWRLGVWATEGL